MKTLLIIAIAALSFTACKSKNDTVNTTNKDLLLLNDSSNMNKGSYLTDTGIAVNSAAVPDTVREVIVSPPVTKTKVIYRDAPSQGSSASNNNSSNSSSGNTQSSSQKKGLSKGAKGAIIGGVGGAVGGAVIGKNAKGAAIGAAVGAAGGYIIGHSKDKKDGRIQ